LKAKAGTAGHKSLRPSFSTSSLSPCTRRSPRPTWVSEGYPLPPLATVFESRGGCRGCHFVAWCTSWLRDDRPI